jgi:hypothetical protein
MITCIETDYFPLRRQTRSAAWHDLPMSERWAHEYNRRQTEAAKLGIRPRPIAIPTGLHAEHVLPRISGCRWVAECPICHQATKLAVTDPRYICTNPDCLGGGEQLAFPVDMPASEDCVRLELILALRPIPRSRSWIPPETLADLIAENSLRAVDMGLERRAKIRKLLDMQQRAIWGDTSVNAAYDLPFGEWGLRELYPAGGV